MLPFGRDDMVSDRPKRKRAQVNYYEPAPDATSLDDGDAEVAEPCSTEQAFKGFVEEELSDAEFSLNKVPKSSSAHTRSCSILT